MEFLHTISRLNHLFLRYDVGQALRNICYRDITFTFLVR